MPVKRKVGVVRRTLGPLEFEHLGTGRDHLLADGPGLECWICKRGLDTARGTWIATRAEILANWDRLEMPFPPLGAILFDGERLPALDPAWRELYRWKWEAIRDELQALTDA